MILAASVRAARSLVKEMRMATPGSRLLGARRQCERAGLVRSFGRCGGSDRVANHRSRAVTIATAVQELHNHTSTVRLPDRVFEFLQIGRISFPFHHLCKL